LIDVRMRERSREVLDADFKVRCRSGADHRGNRKSAASRSASIFDGNIERTLILRRQGAVLQLGLRRCPGQNGPFDSPLNVKLSVMAASVQDLVRNRTRRARPWWP